MRGLSLQILAATVATILCCVAAAEERDHEDANPRGTRRRVRLAGDATRSKSTLTSSLTKSRRDSLPPRHRRRDLQEAVAATCKYGCESVPCGDGCQSAFARCNHEIPLCFTNATNQIVNATVQWGWTNPVNCHGGSIDCDLWIGALGCNTSAASSQLIGTVKIDTDSNQVLYEISDDTFRMASVQVYVGTTEVPVVDGTLYSISPEDYTVQSWLDPKAKEVTIEPVEDLGPGMFLIAHANVCPVNITNEIPKVWIPPLNATDPLCPIRTPKLCSNATIMPTPAPTLFAISNLFPPAPSDSPSSNPSSIAVEGGRALQLVDSTCPFKCGNLSCDDTCVDAFAYCPGAECLGPDAEGLATWGHSNPINCTGGMLQCELWTGDDCNHTNGEHIGSVYINTDRNSITYDIANESAWGVSSAGIYVGPSSLFESYEQNVWYDPNQEHVIVKLYPNIHVGAHVIVHASVCSIASALPDFATVPLNATIGSCPVPTQVPCPSTLPTSALATEPPAKSPEDVVTTVPPFNIPNVSAVEPFNVPLVVPLVLPPLESPAEAPQMQPINSTQTTPPRTGPTFAPLPTKAPVRLVLPTKAPVRLVQPTTSPEHPAAPTYRPSVRAKPTRKPQDAYEPPTWWPTEPPTEFPTDRPVRTPEPSPAPTEEFSEFPTEYPTPIPTEYPTELPTDVPTLAPNEPPTEYPTPVPTEYPTELPTELPTQAPTEPPTEYPTPLPTEYPTEPPMEVPTQAPTEYPTPAPDEYSLSTPEPTE